MTKSFEKSVENEDKFLDMTGKEQREHLEKFIADFIFIPEIPDDIMESRFSRKDTMEEIVRIAIEEMSESTTETEKEQIK